MANVYSHNATLITPPWLTHTMLRFVLAIILRIFLDVDNLTDNAKLKKVTLCTDPIITKKKRNEIKRMGKRSEIKRRWGKISMGSIVTPEHLCAFFYGFDKCTTIKKFLVSFHCRRACSIASILTLAPPSLFLDLLVAAVIQFFALLFIQL